MNKKLVSIIAAGGVAITGAVGAVVMVNLPETQQEKNDTPTSAVSAQGNSSDDTVIPSPSPSPSPSPVPTQTVLVTPTQQPTPTIVATPEPTQTPVATPSPEPTPAKFVKYPNPQNEKEVISNKVCELFDTEVECNMALSKIYNRNSTFAPDKVLWQKYGLFQLTCWDPVIRDDLGGLDEASCKKLLDVDFNIRMAHKIYLARNKANTWLM